MSVSNGKVLRASARWQNVLGSDVVNVFYFRTAFTAPQTELNVQGAVNGCLTSLFANFTGYMRDTTIPVDLKVDVVQWLNGKWEVVQNVGLYAWGQLLDASSAADHLPPGVAALGKLYTGAGRHIGKKFFGALTEAVNDVGGNLGSAAATSILAGLAELLTPYVISAGNELVSVVLDHTDGTVRDIIDVAVSGYHGYQRRRRPGAGS